MTRRLHGWERPGSDCSGGSTSGARALLGGILARWPDEARSLGIYNCRPVRGGQSPSVHGEGRAVDVGLPQRPDGYPTDAAVGIVDRILSAAWELGLCYAVHAGRSYSASHPNGKPYKGAHPHWDHVHLELTRDAARRLNRRTVDTLLSDTVRTYAQAVVVPVRAGEHPDRAMGRTLAAGYGLAMVASDSSGFYSLTDGVRAYVSDWQAVVGGSTRAVSGVPGVRLAGPSRHDTARAVFDFIRGHDPATQRRRGIPWDDVG